MAKTIIRSLELVDEKTVTNIMLVDAHLKTSNADQYTKANLLTFYVCINTWLWLIKQWSTYGWTYVLDKMKSEGLFATIRYFSDIADQCVQGQDIPECGLAGSIWRDVLATDIMSVPFMDNKSFFSDKLSAFLLICRYPKRFSPNRADLLKKESIAEFRRTQKRLKNFERSYRRPYFMEYIIDEVNALIDWDKLCDELENVGVKDIEFTHGSSFDTDAALVSKLQSIQRDRAEYYAQPFGIPIIASRGVSETQYWGFSGKYEKHLVKLLAVPKNYKTARVIAPENVFRQAKARAFFNIMDAHSPRFIQLHDQTVNQEAASLGSRTGDLATIDLKAASDSITWTIIHELWSDQPRFIRLIESVLPTHYIYDGNEYLLTSACTMGNSVTFWLESVIFTCISLAAVKYVNLYNDDGNNYVSVYGDDIIVPTDAALTVCEWLSRLGFIVNYDKTFLSRDNLYRESCGEEFQRGICVSSVYFPRFPLEGSLKEISKKTVRDGFTQKYETTLTALVDLQHKLFQVCQPASRLMTELIFKFCPDMTCSTPPQGLQDVWSYEDRPKLLNLPGDTDWTHVDEYHLTPTVTHSNVLHMPSDAVESLNLLNLYNYMRFLRFGPRYADDLMRLLGVSEPPISTWQAFNRTEVQWELKH